MQSSAWPGNTHAGAITVRVPTVSSTRCTSARPRSPAIMCGYGRPMFFLAAVIGLMMTALSQHSFVTGLGNSWSQPLLANRPS